jgi:hypothetical protein
MTMTASTHHFGLALDDRAMFSVPDAAGLQIDCEDGTVWITVDGDLRDYVLEPGDHFHNTEHRRAVIYAMRPARLSIHTDGVAPSAAPRPQRAKPESRGLVFEQVFA